MLLDKQTGLKLLMDVEEPFFGTGQTLPIFQMDGKIPDAMLLLII